jgi:predicted transcriptional regulator
VAEKIKTLQSNLSNLKKEALILRANKKIDELLDLEYIQIEAIKNSLEKEEKKIKRLQGRRRFIYQEINSNEIEKVVSQ